ncbi:restriction endonuclease subunit S [Flavobacterium sp. GT3P67]|uniref:restriction endonuclease subunit S n=1 Tax=Flavobacterium sp. GT3P67 TaxID=2541722 RepID=UPI0010474CB4|nr:restriction endonuclease subunit S [Flavobacterium sp. GT3P67]TDE55384.1 restriction endonuclease subunit S [Flavobacterium sp. GT3P67]
MNNERNKLIPELRFPDFMNEGNWEEKKLGDFGRFFRGLTYSADDTSSKGLLVLRSGNIQNDTLVLDKDLVYVDKECADELKLLNGDIVICMSNGSKALVGKNAEYKDEYDGKITVGAFCSIMRPINKFTKYLLQSDAYQSFIALSIGGGNINNLKNSDLEEFKCYTSSSPKEQQKIADCLSFLDELITAHTDKLETLKTYKKGLMQNLFPQVGEKVPKLRFKEFEKEGDWEYLNGNELFDTISNKNHNSDLQILAITQEQGAIPRNLINYNVIVTEKSLESYKVVEKGDFIISLRSFQGGIEYSNFKGICSPAYIILRKKNENSENEFYKHYFKTDFYIRNLNRNLEGLRDGKMVSYSQFSEILLPNPNPKEQQKIANFLSSLDSLITEQADKIEQLKLHKKGLMQGLFPKVKA